MVVSQSTAHEPLRTLALSSTLCLTLAACGSSMHVSHQDASDVHNRDYRSYGLLEHPVGGEESVDDIITKAIHDQMQLKGYEQEDPSDADLLVTYKVLLSGESAPVASLEDATDRASSSSRPEAIWDEIWVSVPSTSVTNSRDPARDNVLLVMLQEADTYKVVWLGWSSTEVNSKELVSTTTGAIDAILAKIPEAK